MERLLISNRDGGQFNCVRCGCELYSDFDAYRNTRYRYFESVNLRGRQKVSQ